MRWRQTANKLMKWPNADTDHGPEDSALTDDGTRVTSSEPVSIIGTSPAAPDYMVDIRGTTTASQLHFASANADSGGYLTTASANNFFLSAGAAFNGTDWIAKSTSSAIIGGGSGRLIIYTNDSLTAGNTVTVTERARVTEAGAFGIGTASPGARLDVYTADAITDAVTEIARIEHDTTGTAAAGFGARFAAYLESSTTARQLAGAMDWVWSTATHATRTAYQAISVVIAGTLTERVRIADAVKIGDIGGGNYTEIENDGTLEFVGTAMVWDDLRIEPVARTTGSNAPAFEKWFDDVAGTSRGVDLYSFDDAPAGSEKEIFFTMQMPHGWAGTDIHVHVHWVGAVDDTTAEPRWGLEYNWSDIGAVFGDTTIVYAGAKYPTDANVTTSKHYLSEFSAIAPGASAAGLSSVLIGRLFRDSANAGDTYNATGAKCGLLYIDAHYEINTIGSRAELTK